MVLNRRNFLKVAVTSIGLVGSGSVVWYKLQTTLKADESLEEIKLNFEPTTKWDFNWDKREPNYLIKPKSKSLKARLHEEKVQPPPVDDLDLIKKHSSRATRHLFLIRHGQYEIKEKDSEKKILTLLGREQAEFAGKHLKELSVGRFSYNKLHHSSMIRAIETANIIKTHLPSDIPVHTDPLLCEGAPIAPEPPIGSWKPELYAFQDGPRIEAAFRKYFHRAPPEQLEDSYEIVVCHANVIRYFFCRALQFPPEAWLRFDLGHASVTHVIIRPDGRVNCRVLGGTGFQPSAKLSS